MAPNTKRLQAFSDSSLTHLLHGVGSWTENGRDLPPIDEGV